MPRTPRASVGGYVYHVLNRVVARDRMFLKDDDYLAFEKVLAEAHEQVGTRLLSYCLMPNHWHLVLWPKEDGELSRFMRRLTITHTQRWHAHYHSVGTGPLYQGRFRSFPIERDEHLLNVIRYVEGNPLRADLVSKAQDWKFSSLARHAGKSNEDWLLPTGKWPIPRRDGWTSWVNRRQSQDEIDALRICVNRGRPYGSEKWVARTANTMGLESSLRRRGRPLKLEQAKG